MLFPLPTFPITTSSYPNHRTYTRIIKCLADLSYYVLTKKQQMLAHRYIKQQLYKYIIQLNNNLKLDSMVATTWFSTTSFVLVFKFIEHVQSKYQERKNNKRS